MPNDQYDEMITPRNENVNMERVDEEQEEHIAGLDDTHNQQPDMMQ